MLARGIRSVFSLILRGAGGELVIVFTLVRCSVDYFISDIFGGGILFKAELSGRNAYATIRVHRWAEL